MTASRLRLTMSPSSMRLDRATRSPAPTTAWGGGVHEHRCRAAAPRATRPGRTFRIVAERTCGTDRDVLNHDTTERPCGKSLCAEGRHPTAIRVPSLGRHCGTLTQ